MKVLCGFENQRNFIQGKGTSETIVRWKKGWIVLKRESKCVGPKNELWRCSNRHRLKILSWSNHRLEPGVYSVDSFTSESRSLGIWDVLVIRIYSRSSFNWPGLLLCKRNEFVITRWESQFWIFLSCLNLWFERGVFAYRRYPNSYWSGS